MKVSQNNQGAALGHKLLEERSSEAQGDGPLSGTFPTHSLVNRPPQECSPLSARHPLKDIPCSTWLLWLCLAVVWGRCSLLEGEVQFYLQEVPSQRFAFSMSIVPPEAGRQITHVGLIVCELPGPTSC